MQIESDDELVSTPPEIRDAAKITEMELLPEKSRNMYLSVFNNFMDWRAANKIGSFSESVLLVYFSKLSEKYKSSTLWSHYSMLKSTLAIHEGIDIEKYKRLRSLLKRKSEGFQPKKAKVFSAEEMKTFLSEACDEKYLATKVTMIMGVMGECRANEMYNMRVQDVKDLGSAFLVNVPNTKTKINRKFTITEDFYLICKKYIDLRPAYVTSDVFFLNYQNGKCTSQRIGINKFAKMGRGIAEFLKLPNSSEYSGHSFRRSSATVLVDAGGDITALKRHGGWKSTTVAEGYIEESMRNKMDTAHKISSSIRNAISTEHIQTFDFKSSSSQQNIDLNVNAIPSFNFKECSVTININK